VPVKNSPQEESLETYLALLPGELGGTGFLNSAYASVYALTDETFARLLFNLHTGKSPWRGVAPHSSSNRFQHVANILVEVGLVWFDQHKMRWALTDDTICQLGDRA